MKLMSSDYLVHGLIVALAAFSIVMDISVPVEGRRSRGGRGREDSTNADGSLGIAPRPEWRRRRRKNSECRLGGQWYAINSTWNPNLGPPFGVWNCVQCVCKLVQKKRRKVAKVECRNMKNSCEIARCSNPVQLPGSCCKTCPKGNEAFLPHGPSAPDFRVQRDDMESQNNNDFAVLLNGRTSMEPTTSRHVATGRLSLKRSTLHFSFILSEGMDSYSVLQFINVTGEVLEELEAQPTPFAVNKNRLCGTWTRMPKQYRQLLREDKLYVAIVPENRKVEDTLSGKIARYVGVDTEVFSSLLKPVNQPPIDTANSHRLPGGGTAIVSVDSRSESLHISLVFNGVFGPGGDSLSNSTMFLELTPSRSSSQPVQDTFILQKTYVDINTAEVMTTLGDASLPSLTRGKVHIKLWAENAPELAIEGTIAARATCNVFSAVLTTGVQSGGLPEGERFGAGWAVVSLTDEGFFKYQVEVSMPARVQQVSLIALYKRKDRVVHDLTDSYSNGWANGTYTRPTYGDLDALMRGRLQVHVTGDSSSLEGLFRVQPITEAVRSERPALLRSVGVKWAASAWVAVDADCVMHYHVQLAGPIPRPSWQLLLQERDETFDPRFKQQREILEKHVDGWEVADHTTMLTPASLSRLNQGGISILEMLLFSSSSSFPPTSSELENADLLSGTLDAVDVPQTCRLDGDNDGRSRSASCGIDCLNTDEERPRNTKCMDSAKKVYDDGTSWPSPGNPCEQCMCVRGVIKCVTEPCPQKQCVSGLQRSLPAQCCSLCPSNEEERRYRGAGCVLSNKSHPVGSVWHPFLPPQGFDRCVTCNCSLGRDGRPRPLCQMQECPPISDCLETEAVIPDGKCCKECPRRDGSSRTWSNHLRPPKGVVSDEARLLKEKERREALTKIINEGGCNVTGVVKHNGEEWHPRVSPGGEYRCVQCSCKDGNYTCRRRLCPQLTCTHKVPSADRCCQQCQRRRTGKSKRKKGGKRTRNRKMRKNRTNDRGRRG